MCYSHQDRHPTTRKLAHLPNGREHELTDHLTKIGGPRDANGTDQPLPNRDVYFADYIRTGHCETQP